ncbi:hypothetical protein BH10BDE1_BH10BDE1_14270 [soil metagenome]
MGLTATKENKGELIALAEKAKQGDVVKEMTNQMRKASRQGANAGRNVLLGQVIDEKYDEAIEDLHYYLNSKPQYPNFKVRAEKFVQYGVELIEAIRTKRNFPGWNALNMSKQKDLFEKALAHFEDLKATLVRIEAIEREVKIIDVRSTVWVMRACVYSIIALMIFALMRELTGGVLPTINAIVETATSQLVDFAFDKLNL